MVNEPIPWITFAPLEPHWVIPSTIRLPYDFSEDVTLCRWPTWVKEDDPSDDLRSQLRDKIDSDDPTCIQIKYLASALSYEQRDATQQIFLLHLALWLIRGTPLYFDVIAHAEHFHAHWITRHIVSYNPARSLPAYQGASFTLDDLERAKALFHVMLTLQKDGTVRAALTSAMRALVEGTWELRYLLFWLGLESLFGPNDGREITFRLSQRAALFLETDGGKAEEIFKEIKKSYGWRSKIVHGLRITKLGQDESLKLLDELEVIVRRSLMAVLSSETIAAVFDGEGREQYLDGLAFK